MPISPFNPLIGELLKTLDPNTNCIWLQRGDYQISPAAASNTAVLTNTALTASAQAITTGITKPDYPRNVVIKGAVAGSSGSVIIKGTDFAGNSITETIALNGTTAVVGNKAFASVTEVDLPVTSGTGDGVSVGVGSKLGLPYTFAKNMVARAYNNNTLESSAPTVTVDVTNICNNTVTLATSLAGNVVDILLDIPG